MKRKILAIFLCVCMLLPFGGVFSFAEGTELNFQRYFSGKTSDWEIFGGTTSLILIVRGEVAKKLAAAIDADAYTWHLSTNGETYEVPLHSYALVENDNGIILRFPTFEHGFCPSVNPIEKTGEDAGVYYDIDIVATDKSGNTVYYGRAEGLHSQITDPVIPGVGILNGSRLDSGFRNTESATELLFTIKESNMQQFYTDRDKYVWRFTYSDGKTFGSFEAYPTSCNAGSQLLTFEPCLANPPFIPEKNTKYFINLELWQDGVLKYFAGSTIYGYTLNATPLVPSKQFDVTFRVGNQSQTKKFYEGQLPKCDLETQIPSTAAYEYVFKGWEPMLKKVTESVTYTAVYEKVLRKYNVSFVTEKESITLSVPYGETPVYTGDLSPIKTADGMVKVFVGWDKTIEKVTGDATYQAKYQLTELSQVPVLSMEDCHFYRGKEQKLSVFMNVGTDVTDWQFTLLFDDARFEMSDLISKIEGVKIEGNTVSYSGKALTGKVELLSFELKAKEDGAYGNSNLVFVSYQIKQNGKVLGCIIENAVLTLSGILSGDVNEDCLVDTEDADNVIKMLLNKSSADADFYDTNHDGVVDLKDAVRICTYVAGETDDIWCALDDNVYTVTYASEMGGKIEGKMTQKVTRKQSTESVLALSYSYGYAFDGWSDGRNGYKRQEYGVEENVTLTAKFVKQEINLVVPDLRINTLGQVEVDSTTEYRTGMLSIEGADNEEYNVSNLPLQIKGRGNYSWTALKNIKPSYRVRLANKESLLGIGIEERDWVLLSVYNDVTMLRNYTTWRLGELFDNLPHSVKGRYVTLYINDEYRGVYLLCERVEASRLELEDEGVDANRDYLLELDARASGEGVQGLDWFTISGGQQPFVIKSQVNSKKDTQYIQAAVTKLNEAMLSGDKNKIAAIMDIPSLVDSYIIEEFGKDRDVGFASFYIMKKANGKFYFTSPWDFDLGWGNDSAYPKPEGLVSTGGSGNQWFRKLSEQEWFKLLVRVRMAELDEKVQAIAWELEATAKALTEAAKEDEAYFNTIGHRLMEEPSEIYNLQSYEEHVAYYLQWYNTRWQWLCEYFGVK